MEFKKVGDSIVLMGLGDQVINIDPYNDDHFKALLLALREADYMRRLRNNSEPLRLVHFEFIEEKPCSTE